MHRSFDLVSYNIAGRELFHERLLAAWVEQEDWIVQTPDEDRYAESLVAGARRSLKAVEFRPRADTLLVRMAGAQIYGFLVALTKERILDVTKEAPVLAGILPPVDRKDLLPLADGQEEPAAGAESLVEAVGGGFLAPLPPAPRLAGGTSRPDLDAISDHGQEDGPAAPHHAGGGGSGRTEARHTTTRNSLIKSRANL